MGPFYMATFSYRGERVSQNTYQVQNVKVHTEQSAIYYFKVKVILNILRLRILEKTNFNFLGDKMTKINILR